MGMAIRNNNRTYPVAAGNALNRRIALARMAAFVAVGSASPLAVTSTRSEQQGDFSMDGYADERKTINEATANSGLLVVAQWETKAGAADKVADILRSFLPEAQREAGVNLFLIGRGKENGSQFLFYELFRDEAAFKAHQESAHFKKYIAGQALPLLDKRDRAQYSLI
jgi:quinol monooxygenase YgiN